MFALAILQAVQGGCGSGKVVDANRPADAWVGVYEVASDDKLDIFTFDEILIMAIRLRADGIVQVSSGVGFGPTIYKPFGRCVATDDAVMIERANGHSFRLAREHGFLVVVDASGRRFSVSKTAE